LNGRLNPLDTSPLRPQDHLFGCEPKADKGHFKLDNDENEHLLSLRMVSLEAGIEYELHTVEAETVNYEGGAIKVTLAALKMSVPLAVSPGGPLKRHHLLKCGSGLVHISGKHLVAIEKDREPEDEEEEDVKLLMMSGSGSKIPQKKIKLTAAEDEGRGGGRGKEGRTEVGEEDTFDDEVSKEKLQPKNAQKSKQNRKDSKPSTQRLKCQDSFKSQEKTPKPEGPSSVDDVKAKMQTSIEKDGSLPKVDANFINTVKNCFQRTDQEAIQNFWQEWNSSL
uniref:Nucleophosmin n=1 Tax=Otolemur garnettii TaxID=30611 RepID=H0XP07_OTOGA